MAGRHLKSSLAFLCVAAVLVFLFSAGCRRQVNRPTTIKPPPSGSSGDSLDSAREIFYKSPDLTGCRNGIQKLNIYFNRQSEDRPYPLSDKEREAFADWFGLDDGELSEIANRNFTLLDAYYLDACFLLNDVVRSLAVDHLPPLEKAAKAFAWACRQVRLFERGDAVPVQFALRRGWGNNLERSLIFLDLLKQMGIDGCMLAFPGDAADQPLRWLPGALIGKEIHVFDSRLGLPLPGPNAQGVATLKRLSSNPDLLKQLTVDPKYPYDITPEQAKRAQIFIVCSLSSLAPRMKYLESNLPASHCFLSTDPASLMEKFKSAVSGKPIEVKFWRAGGDPNAPVRLLRSFLPSTEGGNDRSRRHLAFLDKLSPAISFSPRALLKQPWAEQMEQSVLDLLWGFYLDHGQSHRVELPGRLETYCRLWESPGQPRDLILRGRSHEATRLLVSEIEFWPHNRSEHRGEQLQKELDQWQKDLAQIIDRLGTLEENYQRQHDAATAEALDTAKKNFKEKWRKGIALFVGPAVDHFLADANFFVALCKQDEAERLQNKSAQTKRISPEDEETLQAWKEVSERWSDFLLNFPNDPSIPAARRMRALTLTNTGKADAARPLLLDLSGNMSDLEKAANLFLAKQLR